MEQLVKERRTLVDMIAGIAFIHDETGVFQQFYVIIEVAAGEVQALADFLNGIVLGVGKHQDEVQFSAKSLMSHNHLKSKVSSSGGRRVNDFR